MSHTFTITPASLYLNDERCYQLNLYQEGTLMIGITQTIEKTKLSIEKVIQNGYKWHPQSEPDKCEITTPQEGRAIVKFHYPSQPISKDHSWGNLYTLFARSMGLPPGFKDKNTVTFVTFDLEKDIEAFNKVSTWQLKGESTAS